jgi:hypothetical protein
VNYWRNNNSLLINAIKNGGGRENAIRSDFSRIFLLSRGFVFLIPVLLAKCRGLIRNLAIERGNTSEIGGFLIISVFHFS